MNKTTKTGLIVLLVGLTINILLRLWGKTLLEMTYIFPLGTTAHLVAVGAVGILFLLSVLMLPIGVIIMLVGFTKKNG
jgi:hypothetical protein